MISINLKKYFKYGHFCMEDIYDYMIRNFFIFLKLKPFLI